MWGMGGWSGSDDQQSFEALDEAIALGCNFFDTAWAYGAGHSERLLGRTLARHAGERLYVATKVPPKNFKWPGRAETPIADVFPPDHIREYTEKSLENLGTSTIDLQQFHVWSDAWAEDEGWKRAVEDLKRQKLIDELRDQREPLGGHQRAAGAGVGPRRRRAGRLQHLRPGAGGRAVPCTARRMASRSSRASRSTKAA